MNFQVLYSRMEPYRLPLLFLTSFLCAILFGFFVGVLFMEKKIPSGQPIQFLGEVHKKIPTITLLGTAGENLLLESKENDLRLINENDIYTLKAETIYKLPLWEVNKKTLELIEDRIQEKQSPCSYMASEKGKIAYPRRSTQAEKLKSPKCFATKEAVFEAGLELFEDSE